MPAASTLQTSATSSGNTDTAFAAFSLGTTGSWVSLVDKSRFDCTSFPRDLRDAEHAGDGPHFQAAANAFRIAERPIDILKSNDDDANRTPLIFFPIIRYILELRAIARRSSAYETTARNTFPSIEKFLANYDKLPEKGKRLVRNHTDGIFLCFLEQAMKAAKERANEQGYTITKLFPTFPSTWTRWTQKYYAACLGIVWKLDVVFIHESEAIVNLAASISNTWRVEDGSTKLIVVDLGEHILNLSTLVLESHGTDPAKFHLCSECDDISVHSGIHQHETLVRERIRTYIESKRHSIPDSDQDKTFQSFIASYMNNCHAMVDGDAFGVCVASSFDPHHQVFFSNEDSRKMRHECFELMFKTLDEFLDKPRTSGMTEVVLAGVGFRNTSIREEVKRRVKDRGFALHGSTNSHLNITHPTNVAKGAACAISNTIAVDEFMQSACYAVQDTGKADSSGAIIWGGGSSKTARILVPKQEDRLIVCYPASKDAAKTQRTPCYDFAELSLPRGELDVHMEFRVASNGDNWATVYCKNADDCAQNDREASILGRYQVYFDCGSRVCFKGRDKSVRPGGDEQETVDSEEPKELRSVTDEEIADKILDQTGYHQLTGTPCPSAPTVAPQAGRRQAFLSALDGISSGNNKRRIVLAPDRLSNGHKGKSRAKTGSGAST